MNKSIKSQLGIIAVMTLITATLIGGYIAIDNKSTTPTNSKKRVVATTSFGSITYNDLVEKGGVELQTAFKTVNKTKEAIIHDFILEEEAKKSNLSKEALIETYHRKHRVAISEADVEKEYTHIKEKYPTVTRGQVKNKLESDQFYMNKKKLIDELVQKYNVTIELDPLTKLDIAKNQFQHIVFGQQSAPLNVTVFSDFQCSHCKSFHMYLEDVQKEFPNLVQVNYRHFPVINRFSEKLALYGYCMNKQNKYKEFSELVYTQQGKLNDQNLDMMLSPIRYNQSSLNTCLTSSVPSQALASDVGEGRKINVRATPTIIINGFVGSQDDLNLEIKKRTL